MAKKSPPLIPQAPPPTAAGPSFFERTWLLDVLPAIAAILVFGMSVNNGFVFFDDDKAILYNQALSNPSIGKFFSGQNLGMYAPITWITYWIGNLLSGKEAWGYHLLGLILHAGNAVMVSRLLRALTGNAWAAFAAALLFAVHPMQAEAVCWAAALSTVLFSTFYLASLLAYVRWAKGAPLPWLLLSILSFLLACLSKSAAVTLPFVLIAIDVYLFKMPERKFWAAKIPYFIFGLVFGLKTFATRAQEGHDIEASSNVFSTLDRFWMASQTLLFYPVKLLAPLGYSVAYPFVKMDGAWSWTYYAAPVVLAGLAFVVWKYGRKQPNLLLGLALYFLPLMVMLPFRTVGSFELRSDRYVYLSCVGLFFLAALAMEKLDLKLRTGLLVALALIFGFRAWQQSKVWEEGVALFKNCVDKTPESSLCQCNLAYNELITLDFQASVNHYSEALKYDPGTVEAYNGRGQAYLQLRKVPEALSDFTKAIEAGISTPKLFLNRGKCLVMLNRPKEAIPDLDKSLSLELKSFEAFYFRAVAKEKTGDIPGAITDYGSALSLKPDYVEALVNRGLLYMNAAQYPDAINDYTKALAVNTGMEMIWNNRAYAYKMAGKLDKALADANKALIINPMYARGYKTRGVIYQQMGQADKAQADFQMAAQLGLQ